MKWMEKENIFFVIIENKSDLYEDNLLQKKQERICKIN